MKNNLKKLAIFAIGFLLSVVGCGNSENPTTENKTTTAPTTEKVEETTPELTTPELTTPELTTPELTTPEPTTPEPVIPDNIDVDVRLEGEDGIVATSMLEAQNGVNASNGKVAAGINNCGQGLFFLHYAPVGGTHRVGVGYYTAHPNSKNTLIVNNVEYTVVYEESTGWAFEGGLAAVAYVDVELAQGYNSISLVKRGTADDDPQYGGWAQIDYIDILGTQTEFDKETLVYELNEIKIEAELGAFNCNNKVPVGVNTASGGYIVGEINAAGDGATFTINFPEDGKYALSIAYGKDAGERAIDVVFDETAYTYNLEDYEGQNWDVFHESNSVATLEVTKGTHTLSVTRAENGSWFCFDYIVLTRVAE